MGCARWLAALAWPMLLGALVCGVIGLVAGFAGMTWKLGASGWFSGGILLAVIAIAVLANEYFQARKQSQ